MIASYTIVFSLLTFTLLSCLSQVGYFQHHHSSPRLHVAAWSPHLIATMSDSGHVCVWVRRLDGSFGVETTMSISRGSELEGSAKGTRAAVDRCGDEHAVRLRWGDDLHAARPCLHVLTRSPATESAVHGPSCSVFCTGTLPRVRDGGEPTPGLCVNAASDAIAIGRHLVYYATKIAKIA